MKYSILVPVYNVEKYLEQCLDSLANQTFRDYEVILTDDGSKDNSPQICDRYVQQYPNVFKVFHKENEGLLLTRRHALKRASGEYIIFVDSDDYVADNLLEEVDKVINSENCDMVIYNFMRFDEEDNNFTSPDIEFEDHTVFEGENKRKLYEHFVLRHTFVNMWIKAVKKDIVDIDFDYSNLAVSKAEDVMQSFPLFDSAEKIVFIDKKLYFYRKNSGSMTLNVKLPDFDDYIKSAIRTKEYIEIWKLDAQVNAQDTANKVIFFYNYLRKAKMSTIKLLYKNAVGYLFDNCFFAELCETLDVKYVNKRLRLRISIFRRCVKHRNRMILGALISLSNILSKGRKGK